MSDGSLPPRPKQLYHKPTIDEQIAAVEYELRQRHAFYERLIAEGKQTRRGSEAHLLALWAAHDSLVWTRANRAAVIDAYAHIESLKKEPAVQVVLNEFPDASIDQVRDINEEAHDE